MASVLFSPPRQSAPLPPLAMHRFTVDQYHRMISLGIFTSNDHVELLEGWIVDKMPQHPVHAGTISILLARLQAKLPKSWIVRVQSPVTFENSEPEPDLAVVRGPEERYLSAHPGSEDIAIVIEVADTTLDHDRTVKLRTYARTRIPSYWLVNLVEMKVELYTLPRGGKLPSFRRREEFGVEYGVPVVLDGREIGGIPVCHLFC